MVIIDLRIRRKVSFRPVTTRIYSGEDLDLIYEEAVRTGNRQILGYFDKGERRGRRLVLSELTKDVFVEELRSIPLAQNAEQFNIFSRERMSYNILMVPGLCAGFKLSGDVEKVRRDVQRKHPDAYSIGRIIENEDAGLFYLHLLRK